MGLLGNLKYICGLHYISIGQQSLEPLSVVCNSICVSYKYYALYFTTILAGNNALIFGGMGQVDLNSLFCFEDYFRKLMYYLIVLI